MVMRFFLISLVTVFLSGCISPRTTHVVSSFSADTDREAVYVIPFDATLVPSEFGEPVFNDFVDRLNTLRRKTRVGRFVILKQDMVEVEPAWLIKQTYISGDLWGYVAKSGCCSTDLTVKSRIYLYEPGNNTPSLEIHLAGEEFFEHGRSTPVTARNTLAKRLSRELADALINKLTP